MAKRKYAELQSLILSELSRQSLTINEIAEKTNINWNTVSRQLILLKGHEYVEEIFRHRRLRVFRATAKGEAQASMLGGTR